MCVASGRSTTSEAAGRPTADRRLSRRDWLLVAGTWLGPAVAQAQAAGRPFRIAVLPDFMPLWDMLLKWFVEDLQGHGHVEGRDYVFLRSGIVYGEDAERAVRFAVDAQPDLIFACNLGYIIKAHERTKTIPIVMWASGFPVEGGVADSLGRPGRNVTGLTIYADTQIFAKQVQLLLEVKPGIRRIGALCSCTPFARLLIIPGPLSWYNDE